MSSGWSPPRRSTHLRIFVGSLALIAVSVALLLFGVRMEAFVPATGVVTAQDLTDLRAPFAGIAEPGWYEAEVSLGGGSPLAVRVDRQGNGQSAAAHGKVRAVVGRQLLEGTAQLPVEELRFHRLQPGDLLWPGQVVADVKSDDLRLRLDRVEEEIVEREKKGDTTAPWIKEREHLKEQLTRSVLRAPEQGGGWLVVDVPVKPGQAVQPGERVAAIVPVDPETNQVKGLEVRLAVDERHWGDVAVGQTVRLKSGVHSSRLHGVALAQIERLEPQGEPGAEERRFHAVARVTAAPYALPLGSSCRAEIVVGRKLVYRIILEH